MIDLLITLVIFAVVAYVIIWLIGYLGVPEPIRKVVIVVIVLVAVIWLLSFLGSGAHPLIHWSR